MNSQAPPPDVVRKLQQAVSLHRSGRLDEAEPLYRAVLMQSPAQPDALHFLGVLEGQKGRHDAALSLMDRAIAVNPRLLPALYNRANLLRDMGHLNEALAGYDAALALKSDNVAALNNRGAVLEQLGRHDEAIAAFDRILALKPGYTDALVNRGNALVSLGRHDEASASYDSALAVAPDNAAALYGKGNALAKLGRNYDALDNYTRAIALAPAHAEGLNNRAVLLMHLSRFAEALADYDRALSIKPDYEESLYGRGSALIELNRHDEAIAALQDLMRRNADYPYALGMLVYAQQTACDWRDNSARTQMVQAIRAGKRAASPLALLAVSDSPADKLRCAQIVMRDKSAVPHPPLYSREPYRHERIRVGYLSADFRTHPVSMLMAGVVEHHDRARFEPIAFSYGQDDASPLRTRIKNSFHHFHDVRSVGDNGIASLIADSEVDILVDLTGLTASARPGILALRPAPVQVNYLGFAGTMGAPFIDYIVADRIVIPEAQQNFYTEKVAYLPHCYLPHDKARRVAAEKPTRAQAGLPERAFVFASFNNSYKFSPVMFDVWMRLLKAIDGSVLWLSEVNPAATRNLRREAQARGVDPARLVFAPRLPDVADHLARVALADLFLDTLPYNAHTTAMDALWVSLPVLTSMGESFAGRVAASLLQAANLSELVTESLQAYEAKALALARNPDELGKLKGKLAANRNGGALFDTERFTRNLEAAYRMMWLRSEDGQAPESFYIEEAARA